MTSENVDANGNSFKKLLNLLLLGSGASLFVGFLKLLKDSLCIMILSSPLLMTKSNSA